MTRPVRPVDFDIPDAGRTLFLGRVGSTRPTLIPPPKNQEITFNVHLVSILVTEIGGGFLDLSVVGYKHASPEYHEVCCSSSACSHRVKYCHSRCAFSFHFRKTGTVSKFIIITNVTICQNLGDFAMFSLTVGLACVMSLSHRETRYW